MKLVWSDALTAEALRYMGCPPDKADASTLQLVTACAEQLLAAIRPKYTYRAFSLVAGASQITLDSGLVLCGQDLAAHLQRCDRAVLLCATLGAGGDALIRRTQATDLAAGLAMDACATAAIEAVCDAAEEEIKSQYPACFFPFRFSPGYGDLPLSLQTPILSLLDAPRRIGLCATASAILTPRKSVTAVLGISPIASQANRRGCAVCNFRGRCQFQCHKENPNV